MAGSGILLVVYVKIASHNLALIWSKHFRIRSQFLEATFCYNLFHM